MKKIRYLGLDLAWAPRNSSGGAVFEPTERGSVRLVSTAQLRTHEEVLGWLSRNRGPHQAIIVMNAPVLVENSGGQRACDVLLQKHFGRYHVDDHHVNIVSAGHPRTIARALMRMGFDPDPQAEGDRVVETFTQPAQILLFDLDRPIRLKQGPVGSRKEAVGRYRELLAERLIGGVPAVEPSPALRQLLEADLGMMNGTRLGELEDKLEAVLCAYIAAYLDIRGPGDCAFLGDVRDGYILLPTTARPKQPREKN